MSTLFRRALQFEDAILFVWFVFIEPLVVRFLYGVMPSGGFLRLSPDVPYGGLIGAFFVLSAFCACVVLLTRAPGDLSGFDWDTPSGYAHAPMIFVLGLVTYEGFNLMSSSLADSAFGVTLVIILISVALHRWLPPMNELYRRVLMTPLVLVSGWIFSTTLDAVLGDFKVGELIRTSGTSAFALIATIVLAVFIFYLAFIMAPRALASSGGTYNDWIVRYAFFIAGVLLNIGAVNAMGIR